MDTVAVRLEILKLTYRKDQSSEFNVGAAKQMEAYVLEPQPVTTNEKPSPKGEGKNKKDGNPDILS